MLREPDLTEGVASVHTPRPRAQLVEELHRCTAIRRIRQDELIAGMLRVDACDQRIADLVDELSLHEAAR